MKFENTRYGGFSAQAFQNLREKRNDQNMTITFVRMTHPITGNERIEPVTAIYAVTPVNAENDKKTKLELLKEQFPDYADYGKIQTVGYFNVSGAKNYTDLKAFAQKLTGQKKPEKKRAFPTYNPHRKTPLIPKKRTLSHCSAF